MKLKGCYGNKHKVRACDRIGESPKLKKAPRLGKSNPIPMELVNETFTYVSKKIL